LLQWLRDLPWNTHAQSAWAIDLHTFPRSDHACFVNSVTSRKGNMPSWIKLWRGEQTQSVFSPATRPLAVRLSAGF
jgi:hypothetical protein